MRGRFDYLSRFDYLAAFIMRLYTKKYRRSRNEPTGNIFHRMRTSAVRIGGVYTHASAAGPIATFFSSSHAGWGKNLEAARGSWTNPPYTASHYVKSLSAFT